MAATRRWSSFVLLCLAREGTMAETRKIAAILAADVVGFSRMASADEDRTLARFRALRSELIDPTVASQNGRVFKRTGDGALVEFRSVVEAVRCAITVQNAMIERNVGMPTDQRIDFRIGIHLGDVVEESDGDLMGDGVNIAARLEGIAEPGAICLSEDAYRQVKGRLDQAVIDLGPIRLKNIADPVRVYSLQVGAPAMARPATQPEPPEPMKRSMLALLVAGIVALVAIAGGTRYFLAGNHLAQAAHLSIVVLPFANLSGDPAQDYFADGVTENLTTDLSRIRGSFVIARNTAFTFKGKAIDAKEIGKELGVRYVLEGSVQRDQNRVRVNAQLVDAETGAHLWADRFEEDVSDLFKLQDQVVARLANSLGHALIDAEAQKGARSKNPDAIDLAMRGWAVFYQQPPTKETYDAALTLFEQALKIDPNDAEALTGDAVTTLNQYLYGWTNPGIDYEAKILGQAERAIALAPRSSDAYYVKSFYLFIFRRWNDALGAANAGLAIDPNNAALYSVRGVAEVSLGRFEQAKSDALQAIRLSPRDPFVGAWHLGIGDAELGLGHFGSAIDAYHKTIDLGFRAFQPYIDLAAVYALEGKLDEAKSALAEARRLNPQLTVKSLQAVAPNLPPLFEGARKAGLPEE
jgi:adenylate cyclase